MRSRYPALDRQQYPEAQLSMSAQWPMRPRCSITLDTSNVEQLLALVPYIAQSACRVGLRSNRLSGFGCQTVGGSVMLRQQVSGLLFVVRLEVIRVEGLIQSGDLRWHDVSEPNKI
jgi:hypothetical protein